eukprot:PRCOL_00002982-RA
MAGSSTDTAAAARELEEMDLNGSGRHERDDIDRVYETTTMDTGNTAEQGQVIHTQCMHNGQRYTLNYQVEDVVGNGSFGVVVMATCLETNETVAIKKVLQDKRFKNRELQIMRILDHPCVVRLKHCYYSTTKKEEVYLNLVLEYVPDTVYNVARKFRKVNQRIPSLHFKFPQIKAHPWTKVFNKRMPQDAVELVSKMLQYSPNLRYKALEVCAHPYFDELRDPNLRLPNGRPPPPLFDFRPEELKGASEDLVNRLVPRHGREQLQRAQAAAGGGAGGSSG